MQGVKNKKESKERDGGMQGSKTNRYTVVWTLYLWSLNCIM
jgi:hypothetical protein